MRRRIFILVLATTLILPALAARAWANGVSDQTLLVAKAVTTIERLRANDAISRELQVKLARARAVLIVPDLVKGGFILAAEWGTGVLLGRDAYGRWSGPAFYSVASGSIGLQAGLQDAETVFVIMSEAGLRAIMENRFKAGADAGIAVAHVGAGTEAAVTTHGGADIYAFNKAVGAYGGASLEGSAILPRHSWNAAYYGANPSPDDIVITHRLDNSQANRLRDVLAR